MVDNLPDPPDDSIVGTPDRRPGSVRRTANINMTWPDGFGTALRLSGRARDLLTTAAGDPVVLATAEMTVGVGTERTIESISVVPERAGVTRLVGAQGGGGLRGAIDSALPGESEAGTPLYFLLDDIAGATLIAGFAWSQTRSLPRPTGQGVTPGTRKGRIICSGLRPGGYYQQHLDSTVLPHFLRRAGELAPEDPWAWHAIPPAPAICMRRRRRIDAWRDGPVIEVDAHFRDSLWDPDHVELAVHEYTFTATIDAASHALLATHVVPRVLPFPECPLAAPHASALVEMPVDGFRRTVQDTLSELRACTHLNDMLRGLAEVPTLAQALEQDVRT